MAKCIWVVSKNRKNASCTPPSRSASLTSFPSPAGILEGEVTMPWSVGYSFMLRLRQINLLFHIMVIECPYSCIPCIPSIPYIPLPSTEIRNILVRSNSEAPVIDFPKKLLENPTNISATWGAWSLVSVVFSWHRVHTYSLCQALR